MIPAMSGLFDRRRGTRRTAQALAASAQPVQTGRGLGESARTYHDGAVELAGVTSVDQASGTVCLGSARVDNRAELLRALGLRVAEWGATTPARLNHDDTHLLHAAYLKWGPACVDRIYGDWSFALWTPQERRLFLARDHFGLTSLYYYLDDDTFAFATDQRTLLNLGLAPAELDELYLAQLLVSWPAYQGHRTVRTRLNRLPPAHTLTVDPEASRLHQYWHLENVQPLLLKDRREYVDGFLEVFDEAVRARLRRDEGGAIATTLSGGLDSSSITVTAAEMLDGDRVDSYTSVPIADTTPFVGVNFGDEWPDAQATAEYSGKVDLHAITAESVTPITGLREMLAAHLEPGHAAANADWLNALMAEATAAGSSVLLVGQFGNAGMSWAGSVFSQPLPTQLRNLGTRAWLRENARRRLPPRLVREFRVRRTGEDPFPGTALNPTLARRLNLAERMFASTESTPARNPIQERMWLRPGSSSVGALLTQSARSAGLDIRDPSADARVLAYSWSVPDEYFRDRSQGTDRWLIRSAMKGRLPDRVRLNRRLGRQAGDLPVRLRSSADEVEAALAQVEASESASAVVDVAKIRQAWEGTATEDTPEAYRLSVTMVTRGLMAGIFIAEETDA